MHQKWPTCPYTLSSGAAEPFKSPSAKSGALKPSPDAYRDLWRTLADATLRTARAGYPTPAGRAVYRQHNRCAEAGRELDRLIWRLVEGEYVEEADVRIRLNLAIHHLVNEVLKLAVLVARAEQQGAHKDA